MVAAAEEACEDRGEAAANAACEDAAAEAVREDRDDAAREDRDEAAANAAREDASAVVVDNHRLRTGDDDAQLRGAGVCGRPTRNRLGSLGKSTNFESCPSVIELSETDLRRDDTGYIDKPYLGVYLF